MSRPPPDAVNVRDAMALVAHALDLEPADDARGALALLMAATAAVIGEVADDPQHARALALSIGPAMAELVVGMARQAAEANLRWATPQGSA